MVDAVLSEDTDILAYECPIFLSKLNISDETVVSIKYNDCINELELTSDQFLDLCIMCGTDYNKNIPRIGSKKAFKLIKQYGSIEGLPKEIDTDILKYERVRQLFREFEEDNITMIPCCGKPDFTKLSEFVFKCNTQVSLDQLRKDFTEINIDFE